MHFTNECQLYLKNFNFGDPSERNPEYLQIYQEILCYFFENSDLDLTKYVRWVWENSLPLLIYEDPTNQKIVTEIYERVQDLLKNVLNFVDKQLMKDYLEFLMDETIKNNERLCTNFNKSKNTNMVIPGQNHKGVLENHLKYIELSIVFCTESTAFMALEFLDSLLEHTNPSMTIIFINRLLGCFIRVLTYKLTPNLKTTIVNLIISMAVKDFKNSQAERDYLSNDLMVQTSTSLENTENKLRKDIFQLYISQINYLTMSLLNETKDKEEFYRKKSEPEDLPALLENLLCFENSLTSLAILSNEKSKNSFVKKWAKRLIIDKKFNKGAFYNYLENDENVLNIKDELKRQVNCNTLLGIDEL